MAEVTKAIPEKGIMMKRISPPQLGRVTIRKGTNMTRTTLQTLKVSHKFLSRDFTPELIVEVATPVVILWVFREGVAILTVEAVATMGQ